MKHIVKIFLTNLLVINALLSVAQHVNSSDTLNLVFPFEDDSGLLYDSTQFTSPLMMDLPESLTDEVVYDPLTGEYLLKRTINGKVDYRPPVRMTLQEYVDYDFSKAEKSYWSERARNENFEHQEV